ncbi:MAG: UDP-N-acetylglucosamine 1-carboxyvinyltransferase [Faecousia sp.]
MGAYQIIGGRPLRGVIPIHGAKNSMLPILAATLVSRGTCVLHNCPQISDADAALSILQSLGCQAKREGDTLIVDTYAADGTEIPAALMQKMRAAVIFLGALLARFGRARLSHPGGCRLGERPIDLHLMGLQMLGASCVYEDEELLCTAHKPEAATIALPFPSVGATENLLLAALPCEGETVLCNAAREPEIGDLIGFLASCGAEIEGAGTSVLRIHGGRPLHGAEYTIMPDRMEAATYLCTAAATRGELTLTQAEPHHLCAVTDILLRGGCEIRQFARELTLRCDELRAVSPIRTAPYPAFPTDAQAPVMAAMATAEGISIFEETVFSDRFRHVPALRQMGAKITAAKRCAVVEGVPLLHGANVEATDLRGGAAMVIAALAAQGESVITKTEHTERGYAELVSSLCACGAEISLTE